MDGLSELQADASARLGDHEAVPAIGVPASVGGSRERDDCRFRALGEFDHSRLDPTRRPSRAVNYVGAKPRLTHVLDHLVESFEASGRRRPTRGVPASPLGNPGNQLAVRTPTDHETGAKISVALEVSDGAEELPVPAGENDSSAVCQVLAPAILALDLKPKGERVASYQSVGGKRRRPRGNEAREKSFGPGR